MNLKLIFVFLLGLTLILASVVVDSYSKKPLYPFNDPSNYKISTTSQLGRTYIHSITEQPSVDIYHTISTIKSVYINEKAGVMPKKLTINKGDYTKLFIKNDYEASCVFTIDGYGIKTLLKPKKLTELEFNADKSGHYTFGCKPVCNCIRDLRLGILEVTK